MIFSSRYILNRDYQLCNDFNRAMLVSNQGAEKNINLFIHPAHAIMLSLFNGILFRIFSQYLEWMLLNLCAHL